MKRLIIIAILALLPCAMLRAQEYRVDSGTSRVDSTLMGRNIMSVLGPGVKVNQSSAMRGAFDSYVSNNASKKMSGYRIRVYYENGQSARGRSEAICRSISNAYPGMAVYRTFDSPNYKVCVGDFRTKDEALKVYHALKASYPTALILKDVINYPK